MKHVALAKEITFSNLSKDWGIIMNGSDIFNMESVCTGFLFCFVLKSLT